MMGHIIIVERTIATLNSVKYEKQKGPWFSIFWISIMVKLKKRLDLLLKIIPKVLVVFSISDFRGFFLFQNSSDIDISYRIDNLINTNP